MSQFSSDVRFFSIVRLPLRDSSWICIWLLAAFLTLGAAGGSAGAWADLCDVDNNCAVDRNDIQLITASRNTPALPGDPRDVDLDGLITVNDARQCSTLCTLGRCHVVTNQAPTASVGADQSVAVQAFVELAGSGADANANTLTFLWTLVTPAGSNANLDNATAVDPSFTPDIPGVYTATLVVSDCELSSAPQSTVVTVVGGENAPPILDPVNDQVASIAVPFELQVTASDSDPGDTLIFSLTQAPSGMSIDGASGLIEWTPDSAQTGPFAVSVRVVDAAGAAATVDFQVTIAGPNRAPVAADDAYSARAGVTLSEGAPGVLDNDIDPDNDVLAAELLTPPQNGELTLRADGSFDYRVSAVGSKIEQNFNLVALLFDVQAEASGVFNAVDGPRNAIDNDENTSWLSSDAVPPAEQWFAVQLPKDALVREVRLLRHRLVYSPALAFEILSGTVTLTDRSGALLWSSGLLNFPDTGADIVIPVSEVAGVARVRFDVESITSGSAGIAEFQVFGDAVPDKPNPVLEWAWESSAVLPTHVQVISAPVVGDLDQDGMPEIVFGAATTANQANDGVLRAIRGDTGAEVFTVTQAGLGIKTSSQIAIGNIDADPQLEILAHSDIFGRLHAFEHDGTLKWTSAFLGGNRFGGVLLVDLDADGTPEICVPTASPAASHTHCLNADGSVRWSSNTRYSAEMPIAVDLNLDGIPEILSGGTAFNADGTILWQTSQAANGAGVAVGNFNDDPFPEIVLANGGLGVRLLDHTGNRIWGPVLLAGLINAPPTVSDFDGDGKAEIGIATQSHYVVIEDNGVVKWSRPIIDGTSGNTGSTVFDLNGDGSAEVIYSDEQSLWIFRGSDGEILFKTELRSGTLREYPLAVDVDADGQAEIVAVANQVLVGGEQHGIYVYGSGFNDWARTRPIWNQHTYHVTNVLVDGTVPAVEQPNWLTPGLNNFRQNAFLPNEEARFDRFTYQASDGVLMSNPATVLIDIAPSNTPPRFTSAPDIQATVGVEYLYAGLALDDELDPLTYSLTTAPVGMTIDEDTGLVRWIPVATGSYDVSIRVADDDGFTDDQSYVINVVDAVLVPNVVGLEQPDAVSALVAAGLSQGNVTVASSPIVLAGFVISQNPAADTPVGAGTAVALQVSSGPGEDDTDNDDDGFTENTGDCNDSNASINPDAIEIPGDGIDQDCDGIDPPAPADDFVELIVSPANATLIVGQSISLSAVGIYADQTSKNVTATASWSSGSSVFNAVASGVFTVTATSGGLTRSAELSVVAAVGGDNTLPTAVISLPAANAAVTDRVDVTGTANDANFLKYTLAYAPAGSNDFTVFAEEDTPVVGGVLGRFDPTMLINDTYTIRLTVFDSGANEVFVDRVVTVEENLKVGNFSLSFTDLSIPMSGLPITVTRTYDSRDKRKGDFGIGWKLDVNSLRLSSNRELGTGWQTVSSGLFGVALQATDQHYVTLTLPGGRVERFNVVPSPTQSGFGGFPPSTVSVRYTPSAGTLGKLESLDNNFITILDNQPGPATLLDDTSFNTYDPTRFRYTAADGTQIVLDKVDGVESVTDTSGNRLTFGPGGISHSAGKSVVFTRDGQERITQITDPAGNTQDYTYDANGDLVMHTDPEGFATKFAYNRLHGLIRVTDPLDRVVSRTEYDDDGRIVSITNADGRVVSFSRDIAGRQEVVTDADGNSTIMTYDDRGNVLQVVDPLGGITTNTYDADGNQLTSTNAEGETTTRTFDARSNVLTERNAAGETTTFVYDANDNVTQVTDPAGRITQFEYDGANRLTRRVNALGLDEEVRAYDAAGNLTSQTDANGHIVAYEYDAFGNQTAMVDASGNRSTTAYDPNGAVVSETDAEGTTVTTVVDARGLFTSKTDPLGNTSTFTFNTVGVLTGAADALGQDTALEVDANGKDLAFTDALGNTTAKAYDILGNLTGVTNAAGNTVSYEYDVLSRRIRTVNPDGGTSEVVYDGVGRVIRQIDARGNETTFEYDLAGRNTLRTDALGNDTTFEYDAVGNLVRQTDALGQVFQFTYDEMNRLTRTTFPDLTFTTTTFDDVGNVLTETDALGRVTRYEYDANNNLTKVIEPGAVETAFTYDGNNNRLTQTDALGRVTSFEYDSNGRQIKKIYPDGAEETVSYDTAGRVATVTDPNDDVTDATHDANGQVTQKLFADGSEESYTYTSTGQVATVENSSGTTSYLYDSLDRLQRVTYPDGSVVSYTFDLTGNRASVTNSVLAGPGQTTTYTYDSLNRIQDVIEPDGDTTTYAYDAIGNLASKSHPNGVISTFTYDSLSRLVNLVHERAGTVIAEYDYTVNAVGDRTQVDHADGSRVEYEYDDRRRLIRETHFNAANAATFEQTYTYDAVGNRLTKVDLLGTAVVYDYNDNDQLTSAGTTSYTYDANGNLQSKSNGASTTTFAFDSENQLTRVETPTDVVDYTYDGNGTRLSRSVNSSARHFLVDPNNSTGVSQVLSDYTSGGARLADYTYGFELLSQDRGGVEQRMHRDGSLNVRTLTDDTGAATDQLDYSAFGVVINRVGSSESPYQFATDRYGEQEELTYLRARYYDPETGRFISRDPFEGVLRDPVSLHRYLYANANPLAFSDPSGNISTTTGILIATTVISVLIDVASNVAANKSAGEILISAVITTGFSVIGGGIGGNASKLVASKFASIAIRTGAIRVLVPLAQAIVDTGFWAIEGFVRSKSDVLGVERPTVGQALIVFGANMIIRLVPFGPVLRELEEGALRRSRNALPLDKLPSVGGGIFEFLTAGGKVNGVDSFRFMSIVLDEAEEFVGVADDVLLEIWGKSGVVLRFLLQKSAEAAAAI